MIYRTVLLPNFKTVGCTQAELHCLKVEKFNAYIRPFLQIRSHFMIQQDAIVTYNGCKLTYYCFLILFTQLLQYQ